MYAVTHKVIQSTVHLMIHQEFVTTDPTLGRQRGTYQCCTTTTTATACGGLVGCRRFRSSRRTPCRQVCAPKGCRPAAVSRRSCSASRSAATGGRGSASSSTAAWAPQGEGSVLAPWRNANGRSQVASLDFIASEEGLHLRPPVLRVEVQPVEVEAARA